MDSLSAQLLTDPYTALHEASAEAATDAAIQLTTEYTRALKSIPPPWNENDLPRIAQVLGAALAPLVARYAAAITGVATLRALLNGGKLEFSAAGTCQAQSELLQKLVDLDVDEAPVDEVDELVAEARELLASQHDAGTVAGFDAAQVADKFGAGVTVAVDAAAGQAEAAASAQAASDAAEDVPPTLEAIADEAKAESERQAEAVEAFDAEPDQLAGDEAITVAVNAPPDDAPSAFPYAVYRADADPDMTGAPHCRTRSYGEALSYCRAQTGTPWVITEATASGAVVPAANIGTDGSVEPVSDEAVAEQTDAVADAPTLDVGRPAREAEADRRAEEADDAGVWFTVRRGDDLAGGDFCRTPHYQIALEYCQGSPGVPWTIWQTLDASSAPVLVTQLDEAGDVTEVGERGTP